MAHDVTVPGPFPDDHGGVADTAVTLNTARRRRAGSAFLVPLSAMLTCSAEPDGGPGALRLEVGVHREGVRLGPQLPLLRDSALLLDAAHTLCGVRPTLTDYELSGPVLQTSSADTCPAGQAAGRQGA